ncbi:MAG TPA: DUF3857 domain-containing protein [Mucilaginibacter sp.]|jgi:hypothetical protein|nr:DUF3857 domain-containing protein [Mucilaginibacter sp.]
MKQVLVIAALAAGLFNYAQAQQNFDVSLIPKDLLTHANSVVRDQETSIEVRDLNNTVEHVKKVVTVLNTRGDDNAHMAIYYDKSDVIRSIKGVVYNEFGKQIAKFSESDFSDVSVGDGFSLFESQRVKHYLPAVTEYPYTIAYEYEIRSKQTLTFDQWSPIDNFDESVEKSSFVFNCRPDFNIRYKESNLPVKAAISANGDKGKIYSWQLSNLEAIKSEALSPYYRNVIPLVQLVPEKFVYYGIEGSFTNWPTLGKWIYDKLVADRQQLPKETIDRMKELTKDLSDPKLKAKKIYEYVQHKTHYISVQVGLGGFQPFLASDVDQQNYGDCKALVNYTQALLKAVNIDSWYCIVEAGRRYKVSMQSDFASMEQGNHIILCLPFKNDTTWADCTSQTIPFGYLGDFTDDRTVLACTPDGGKLLHTPVYGVDATIKSRKADFTIDTNGALSGNMTTTLKGTYYDYRDELLDQSAKERDKLLQKIYPINNMVVGHYELKQEKSFDPVTTENIKLSAQDYASTANGKYFFSVNTINRFKETLPRVMNRQNNVYINNGFTDLDEITYTIPPGYHLEKQPLNISIDKPFARYTATMELKGSQLTYKRKFQLIEGTYSKETYDDMIDFYQDVADADDYTVSLIRN